MYAHNRYERQFLGEFLSNYSSYAWMSQPSFSNIYSGMLLCVTKYISLKHAWNPVILRPLKAFSRWNSGSIRIPSKQHGVAGKTVRNYRYPSHIVCSFIFSRWLECANLWHAFDAPSRVQGTASHAEHGSNSAPQCGHWLVRYTGILNTSLSQWWHSTSQ